MMLTRLAFLSNNFTFVSGRQKQWRLEPYVQCGWSKARFHSFFVCPCTTVVKSMGTQSTRYLYCEVCRVFNPTSFKTTVLYNGSVKDKSLKQCFNQRKNALNLRNNVCGFFLLFFKIRSFNVSSFCVHLSRPSVRWGCNWKHTKRWYFEVTKWPW